MEMLHPEWSYQAVLYEMNVRQLTAEGTLRAAAAKLGFLRDMGIDAVWLMPVYPIKLFSAEHPDMQPETAEFLSLLREQTECR